MTTKQIVTVSSLFDGLVFFISPTSFNYTQSEELGLSITRNGGLIVININQRVNYAVGEVDDEGDSLDIAQEFGLKLLIKEWITDCLSQGTLLPDENYLLDEDDVEACAARRKAKQERQKRKWDELAKQREGRS
eukprot:TRINITY_DN1312_c0_g1_i3.p1 TRINITY_DN1312_c0_g1~~TRINITY_DN1312_c0_g1_i3.p1  ORF type:complete len:134 (+),score=25.25 TRINITY_DN1312_c0_g1_i3:53-454(+)